MKSNYQQYR